MARVNKDIIVTLISDRFNHCPDIDGFTGKMINILTDFMKRKMCDKTSCRSVRVSLKHIQNRWKVNKSLIYNIAWLGSAFIWKKEANISIFFFQKIKELNERKCEKEFLLYMNFDSKCLSIDI